MSKRKWPVGSFVPCSPRHLHCSPAHAEFVANYRVERHRQEVLYEVELNNEAEYKLWKENGGSIVTFKSWLIAHKGSGLKWQRETYETEPKCTQIQPLSSVIREQSAAYVAGSTYGYG